MQEVGIQRSTRLYFSQPPRPTAVPKSERPGVSRPYLFSKVIIVFLLKYLTNEVNIAQLDFYLSFLYITVHLISGSCYRPIKK